MFLSSSRLLVTAFCRVLQGGYIQVYTANCGTRRVRADAIVNRRQRRVVDAARRQARHRHSRTCAKHRRRRIHI
jgi:hypothetical protein